MLEIRNLSAGYNASATIRDMDFSVSDGEVVALIGPNGAGKTTAIRVISGILKPKSGKILYAQKDLVSLPANERAKILAVVPQSGQMGGAFSVEHAVTLGRTPHIGWLGQIGERDKRIVSQAMAQAGITHLGKRHIAELSGGEQQRVMLARALAQDTPVLLLDEPTSHLDLKYQSVLLSLVRDLAREKNLAVLMALHDLNLVSFYCHRVILMCEGGIVAQGTPIEVLTEEYIQRAYGVAVQTFLHPGYDGIPVILLK